MTWIPVPFHLLHYSDNLAEYEEHFTFTCYQWWRKSMQPVKQSEWLIPPMQCQNHLHHSLNFYHIPDKFTCIDGLLLFFCLLWSDELWKTAVCQHCHFEIMLLNFLVKETDVILKSCPSISELAFHTRVMCMSIQYAIIKPTRTYSQYCGHPLFMWLLLEAPVVCTSGSSGSLFSVVTWPGTSKLEMSYPSQN